jgi:polysaccharide biosynthesis protein PslA
MGNFHMNFGFKHRQPGATRLLGPQSSIAAPESAGWKPLSVPLIRAAVRVSDLSIIGLTGLAIYMGATLMNDHAPDSRYLSAIGVTVFFAAAVFQWAGVYSGDYVFSRRRRIDRVLMAWSMSAVLMIVAAFSLGVSDFYSRLWAGSWFVASASLLAASRILLSGLTRVWVKTGRFADRTVIVGTGPQGARLAQHLKQHGDMRTKIIGFVDDRRSRMSRDSLDGPYLGNLDTLLRLVRENKVDQVFVALPWSAEERLRNIAMLIATTPVRVHLAPDMAGFQFPGRSFSLVAQVPMLHLFDRPISGTNNFIKAGEDFLFGSLIAVLLAPIMALIALAIRLDSPGPIFFRQKRQGFNNNLIEVWKFRTMYTDMTDADCAQQTTRGDPRITRIGGILRRTSLDELPQLFNVLNGTMSLVGPRPHAMETKSEGRLLEDVVDRYAARHRVKPGITGWAQVNGWRGETDTAEKIERRVEHDLYYIDNWSLFFDLKILIKTVVAVVNDDNAF